MKQKTITLCGKQVTLGYCYATEIAYKDYTGENIQNFIAEAAQAVNSESPQLPDIKKSVFAILSAALAYSNSRDEESPIKDSDLMNDLNPVEFGAAVAAIIELWSEFYRIPDGEPREKESKKGKGRSKN